METGSGFNPFSDEEIREIALALGGSDAVSEAELKEIIRALQENTLSDTDGRTTQQEESAENPVQTIIQGRDDYGIGGATGTGVVETVTFPTASPHARESSEMDSLEPIEIISEEEVKEVRMALENGDLCKATEKLSASLHDIENAHLNIAVTGETGSGKSTFVNAIRGLDNDEEEGAAKTGVTETTMEPKAYQHLQYNNMTIWDLPGTGSPNFKAREYLQDVNFNQYDFFIIVSSVRFRQNDMDLAEKIKAMGKKFYFVRNKVDADLNASQIRRKNSYDEEKILSEIRDDCITCLHKGGIEDQKVFLISCLDLSKYDFYQLQETLEEELPSHKKHVFMLCLPNISLPILEKKRKALRRQIWMWATLSCAVAIVPVPGLSVACDIGILVREMIKYRNTFGLDPVSLNKLATKSGKDVNELKSVIKSPIVVKEINKELVTTLLTRGAAGSLMFIEYMASNIPVVGTLAAGGISFGTTYAMLYYFLKDVAEDAVRVLKKALDSPV